MSKWNSEKKIVLEAAQEMAAKRLVVGTAGNISLHLPDKRQLLAVTPSSMPYDTLKIDDIQIVDFEGKKVEGNLYPSIETPLHIGIYKARKNVDAIIHTHSVYASALAVSGREIPPIMEDQVAYLGGEIKLAAYALSGSPELVKAVIEALSNRNGALLANHGVVGIGRTMRDAFTACEMIETTAKIYLLSLATGKVNILPADAVESVKAIYARSQTTD